MTIVLLELSSLDAIFIMLNSESPDEKTPYGYTSNNNNQYML